MTRLYTDDQVREAIRQARWSGVTEDTIVSSLFTAAPVAQPDLMAVAEAVRDACAKECDRLAVLKEEQADAAYATGRHEECAEFTVRRDTYYASAGCIRMLSLAPIIAGTGLVGEPVLHSNEVGTPPHGLRIRDAGGYERPCCEETRAACVRLVDWHADNDHDMAALADAMRSMPLRTPRKEQR